MGDSGVVGPLHGEDNEGHCGRLVLALTPGSPGAPPGSPLSKCPSLRHATRCHLAELADPLEGYLWPAWSWHASVLVMGREVSVEEVTVERPLLLPVRPVGPCEPRAAGFRMDPASGRLPGSTSLAGRRLAWPRNDLARSGAPEMRGILLLDRRGGSRLA